MIDLTRPFLARATSSLLVAGLAVLSSSCKDPPHKACVDASDAYVAAKDKRSKEALDKFTLAANLCSRGCERGEKESCAADDAITVALCDLEGKPACERICKDDKNEAACKKVSSM